MERIKDNSVQAGFKSMSSIQKKTKRAIIIQIAAIKNPLNISLCLFLITPYTSFCLFSRWLCLAVH